MEASHRCGYVRVPPGHPLYLEHYDHVDVDVHGGLTFAEIEPCTEHEDGQGWWFGFDCAHHMDALMDPNAISDSTRKRLEIERMFRFPAKGELREHYWTQAEVEAEVERLADQLAA
jgi:hypothetical protein